MGFVQKCLLERKRSYLTEKGLFLLKAPSSSESMQTHSALVFSSESAGQARLGDPRTVAKR